MEAIIILGGSGSRMRPLSLTMPKALIPFCNKPIIEYQLEKLQEFNVKRVILAVREFQEKFISFIHSLQKKYSFEIVLSVESEPLGTAGCLKQAQFQLLNKIDPVIALNCDIICDFSFQQLLKTHKENNAIATILVTKKKDPSKYGTVILKDTRVEEFLEKDATLKDQYINAGVYILEQCLINSIELRNLSIEQNVFPDLAKKKSLYAYRHCNFWIDLGETGVYLESLKLYLDYIKPNIPRTLNHKEIVGNVYIDESALIDNNCVIGPDVSIGANVHISPNVYIKNSVIMDNVYIMNSCLIENSIIGPHAQIKAKNVKNCVVGENAEVVGEQCKNTHVFPNTKLNV